MTGITRIATVPVEETPDVVVLGGMAYREDTCDVAPRATIDYPYTTYYRRRLHPFTRGGITYRPLAELRLPLLLIDTGTECRAVELPRSIETEQGPAEPFIGWNPDESRYEVVVPDELTVSEKDAEWLGTGRTRTESMPAVSPVELVAFTAPDWERAARTYLERNGASDAPALAGDDLSGALAGAKRALFRGWDDDLGTFLQLPWRDRPGFALSEYSYGLLAHEAKRLDYLGRLDDAWAERWTDRLVSLFTDPAMHTDDLRVGDGIAWYNTVDFDGDDLVGSFYLGTGYYGYPGGQATIALHLLNALDRVDTPELERLVERNLAYIRSTQNRDGTWPMAIRQEPELPFQRTRFSAHASEGATAACVRALLASFDRSGDAAHLDAALRGLETLRTDAPDCSGGLRDIGVDDTEGFSALAAANAFLDAHDLFDDASLLDQARTYASHLLTFTYWDEVAGFDARGVAHPIAETITMRFSPYETLLAARVYRRLADATGDAFWHDVYDHALARVLALRNPSGGLSEGVFYDDQGLLPMHTEQTFATAELLHTLASDDRVTPSAPRTAGTAASARDGRLVHGDVAFDPSTFTLTRGDTDLDLSLVFHGPYTGSAAHRRALLHRLRGHKLLAGLRHVPWLRTGIRPSTRAFLGTSITDTDPAVAVRDGTFTLDTGVHTVTGELVVDGDTVRLPLTVKTRGHDVPCSRVALELDGAEPDGDALVRGDVRVTMDSGKPEPGALDLSRATNWTHGGIYDGEIRFEF